MNEQVFEARGPDGLVRRGILGLPFQRADTAVVLLPAGLKYRVGPHRLNVLLARRLTSLGFVTLRADPHGIGDSDGSLPAGTMREAWLRIEQGEFVDDALLFVDELRQRCGVTRVILGGLCGGALTAQLAAARAPGKVQGLLSFSAAVLLRPVEGTPVIPSTQVARGRLSGYLRKLRSGAALARLLRGESDIGGIVATLRGAISTQSDRVAETTQPENPRFIDSFKILQSAGIPHLLVFGSADNRWAEFEDTMLRRRLGGMLQGPEYEVVLIQDANHEFQAPAWTRRALDVAEGWLVQRFAPVLDRRYEAAGLAG